jgi:hypothetical protein
MDNTNTNDSDAPARSAEEMEWDSEFADMKETRAGGIASTVGGLAVSLLKLPMVLVKLPMAMLPAETAGHARASLLEGFRAVRSLVDTVNDNIEGVLSDGGAAPTVKGPQGTWGSSTQAPSAPAQGKARRIEVQDEVEESGGGDGSGKHITIDDLGENSEGRGLRADIDY